MKTKVIIFILLFPSYLIAQKEITFSIEKLEPPKTLLKMSSVEKIYENLILEDYQIDKIDNITVPLEIVSGNYFSDSLVSFGYNSFFYGMYHAYAEHRPFVLSPDMIWLLICQGFAQHVNANAESLRKYFVDFNGRRSLIVRNDEILLEDRNAEWEKVFPEFTNQISKYTGEELIRAMTADFSTTTVTEKIASEITLMKATEPYFEFVVIAMICGIPEVTLKGTPEDWKNLLNKAKLLEKYDLGWWIKELEPLLEEFVKASSGEVNKRFWRNMFKYHSLKEYGAPKVIDGWIVKFFPYDKKGKRNGLKEIKEGANLPDEIVKVDLLHVEVEKDGNIIETPLELWAGFIGLEQDIKTFALLPKIGWMVRKKDTSNIALKQKLQLENSKYGEVNLRIKEVPKEVLELQNISSLRLTFEGDIIIPDEMKNMVIDNLYIKGNNLTNDEIRKICLSFPKTNVVINGKSCSKNG